jgi:hypothetical protein
MATLAGRYAMAAHRHEPWRAVRREDLHDGRALGQSPDRVTQLRRHLHKLGARAAHAAYGDVVRARARPIVRALG